MTKPRAAQMTIEAVMRAASGAQVGRALTIVEPWV
jgi:hypothetical protein